MRDQLAETKERYREASGGVTERTRALADVSETDARDVIDDFFPHSNQNVKLSLTLTTTIARPSREFQNIASRLY